MVLYAPFLLAIDFAAVVPIVLALLGSSAVGGGVALYMAKPRKALAIAEAADKSAEGVSRSVDIVVKSLDRLDEENAVLRERVAVLEDKLGTATTALANAQEVGQELRYRIQHLTTAVVRLGGQVDDGSAIEGGASHG